MTQQGAEFRRQLCREPVDLTILIVVGRCLQPAGFLESLEGVGHREARQNAAQFLLEFVKTQQRPLAHGFVEPVQGVHGNLVDEVVPVGFLSRVQGVALILQTANDLPGLP